MKVADAASTELPPDWALDAQGPSHARPLGRSRRAARSCPSADRPGHKGFGLSLAVTALGALAPQGAFGTHRGSSTVMIAVDLERFREPSEYTSVFGAFLDYVRETPRQPGVEEIVVPGELERRSRDRRRSDGIDLDDGTWQRLADAAVQTGIEPLPGMSGA